MTEEEIKAQLHDRKIFEKSIETETAAQTLFMVFVFLGSVIFVLVNIGGIINLINDGYFIYDSYIGLICVSIFLYLCALIPALIGRKTNYKVYDALHQHYIQNPEIWLLEPLFHNPEKGLIALYALTPEKEEQQELEILLTEMYLNNPKMQKIIDNAFDSSMKRRLLKDEELREKIISINPELEDYNFRIHGYYCYKNKSVLKCFIYLKMKLKTKNFSPKIDNFFEINLEKIHKQ